MREKRAQIQLQQWNLFELSVTSMSYVCISNQNWIKSNQFDSAGVNYSLFNRFECIASERKRTELKKKPQILEYLHCTSSKSDEFCRVFNVGCSITHRILALWCARYTAGNFASLLAPLFILYGSLSACKRKISMKMCGVLVSFLLVISSVEKMLTFSTF